MRYLKVLVVVLLFFLGITFFLQNTQLFNTRLTLQYHLLGINWDSAPTPVYLFILSAFVLGVVVSLVAFFLDKLRRGKELRTCRSRIHSLEQEINSLRTLPLDHQPGLQQSKDS